MNKNINRQMEEYIKKQDAIDTVNSVPAANWLSKRYSEELERVPAADVRPVVRGKWIEDNIVLTSNPPQFQWHCSECGKIVHWFNSDILTPYCPDCGADMQQEK